MLFQVALKAPHRTMNSASATAAMLATPQHPQTSTGDQFRQWKQTAYLRTRYSGVGSSVALECSDTAVLLDQQLNARPAYFGQLLVRLYSYGASWRNYILFQSLGVADWTLILGLKFVDLVLFKLYLLFCLLPTRAFVVYGSLVLGARCCWEFMSGRWWCGTLALVSFSLWACYIATNYLERPEDWSVSTWPRTFRGQMRAASIFYKQPVFWNAAGILTIVASQYLGAVDLLI